MILCETTTIIAGVTGTTDIGYRRAREIIGAPWASGGCMQRST